MTEEATTQTPPPANTATEAPEWAKNLDSGIGKLGTGIDALVTLAKQAQQRPQTVVEPVEETEGDDPGGVLDEANLEMLPRREFAKRVLEDFDKNLAKRLKPLEDGITNARMDAARVDVKAETNEFAKATPDFHEWKDEMIAIANAHPTLRIREIYALARSGDAEKVKTLGEKYKKADPAEATKPKPPKKLSAMGITPSGPSGDTKNTRMNAQDAAEAAWNETVAKFGGSPFD